MKVAYFSPFPPERSGIADYSAHLLPALERRMRVRVARRGARRPPFRTDVALYHIGNNPEVHDWIVRALRRRPGVVVLHEYVLHHLVAGMTLGKGDPAGYLDAMEREAGPVGRLLAHGVVDGILPPLWVSRAAEFPLAGWILDAAQGLIVHSHYVEKRAREAGYGGPIWRIPMPAWPVPETLAEAGLRTERRPLVGCFGFLNPDKRIPELLQAFAVLRRKFPNALLVLAGTVAPSIDLETRAEKLGLTLGSDMLNLGFVDEARLWALIGECDVCVSLRGPTMGETSAMALQVLALGKPLVVSDVGWFSELPGSVAVKVPVGEGEVELLAAALELLADDAALRGRLGEEARAYAQAAHDLDTVAELYAAALEEAAGGQQVRDAVIGGIATAAHEVGLAEDDPELASIGARAKELGLGD
jgi:glycosyltransferase involved in cell wall biosynthesis